MNSGAERAEIFFEGCKFLNLLDTLIPKNPFSFFAEFWVRVTSGARGSVFDFAGAVNCGLFFGEGRI